MSIVTLPTYENFIKGLEAIRDEQLTIKESSKYGVYPHTNENGEVNVFGTGVITPKDQHYLINGDGSLSFTQMVHSLYEDKEVYPPFSCAEFLLESRDDFAIDYNKANEYYNLNKNLVMKENENILSSREFKPDHAIALTVNQELKEVKVLLEEQGQYPSKNPEVSALLDQHFSKIEKLLADFSEKIEKASREDLPQLEENLKGKLGKIFTDLKDGLKQLFVDMKDQVRSGIENKVNDVKVNIHNSVAEKVQGVNNIIKKLTTSLDEKYQIIDKEVLKQEAKVQDAPAAENATEAPNQEQTGTSEYGQLEKENKELKKANAGLKTFVNVVKSHHPEVYQAIYNTMKGVQQGEQKQIQTEIKPNVKEVELQL